MQAVCKCNLLYCRAKVTKSAENEAKYRTIRNEVVSLLRKSKQVNSIRLTIENFGRSSNEAIKINNNTSTIPTLQTSGTILV